MSPHQSSIGSRSRDWADHTIMLILLVWNHDAAAYWCVWGHIAVGTPISSSAEGNWRIQYNLVYSDRSLIPGMQQIDLTPLHDKHPISWCLRHHASLSSVGCGLNSSFGGCLINCLSLLDPKRTVLLSSGHKMLLHFSLGQPLCSLANCNLLHVHVVFFSTMGLFFNWLILCHFGYFFPSIRMLVFHFLPHLSGFSCHLKAFEIILAEFTIIFCPSLHVFQSPINYLIK